MFFNSKYARIPSALMVLGALAVGCGDDDDKGPKGDGGTLIDAGLGDGGGAGDSGGGGATPTLTDITGTLVPILAVDKSAPIAVPHVVEILNYATGKPYTPPITGTTAAGSGNITIKAPPDPVMIWIKGVMSGDTNTYDTVIANMSRTSGDDLLRISSAGTLSLANASGGFMNNPDRAALTGSIYWSQSGVRKGTIGCAKVFVDGKTANDTDQDQLYNAASGLPGPYSCAAGQAMCTPVTQTLRQGRFYIANATVGLHKLKVSLDNGATFIGPEVSVLVPFARKDASSPTKAVLVQVGIDVEGAANPTPASCPQ
jgi:hypothetical protein